MTETTTREALQDGTDLLTVDRGFIVDLFIVTAGSLDREDVKATVQILDDMLGGEREIRISHYSSSSSTHTPAEESVSNAFYMGTLLVRAVAIANARYAQPYNDGYGNL
jgi:hypothetical protein